MKNKRSVSRREFLRTAGAAAAGAAVALPAIVPSSVFGAEAPSNLIVMGCIGVGGRGTGNMRAFLGSPGVRVVAVCDVDKRRRDRAAGVVNAKYKNSDCFSCNDFRELVARKDIDAVTVCTPDHWHALISIAAAKAGKDIYCEKPLANSVAEGRAVCDAVTRYGRVLQTGSQERSGHNARFTSELVRNGRIGKLHTVRVNLPVGHQRQIPPQPPVPVPPGFDYDMWLGPAPWAAYTPARCHVKFRYILDYSGGEMTDRGAHVIDLVQLGLGTDDTGPVEISGRGSQPPDGLFNTFVKYDFQCRYANGVQMIGQSAGQRGIKFEGSDGWIFIHVHGGRLKAEPQSLLREKIGPNEINVGRSPGHHRNFLDAVRERVQPVASAEIGHRTASICHLVNIAMLLERKLKWDPEKEQVIGDNPANRMVAPSMREPWRL
jgi:predicted dehydrogenase